MQSKSPGVIRSIELATTLEAQIVDGGIAIGEALPAERDLMVQYQVSRATVREALRILGAKGLIAARRGRLGGSYVQAPTGSVITQSLDLFIQGHDIRFSDLLATREAIEPVAAAKAALNRTDDDITSLNEILDRTDEKIEDIDAFCELNVEWHTAVVKASYNPLFLSFMASISTALYAASNRDEFGVETRRIVARAHRRITEAIIAEDPEKAQKRMERHVTSYSEQIDLRNNF